MYHVNNHIGVSMMYYMGALGVQEQRVVLLKYHCKYIIFNNIMICINSTKQCLSVPLNIYSFVQRSHRILSPQIHVETPRSVAKMIPWFHSYKC